LSRSFIDTNVIVYEYDARDETKRRRAYDLLRSLGPGEAVISGQVLGEFYSTVTRKLPESLSPADAAQAVERLSAAGNVVPIGPEVVADAITISERWQLAYWDGLILAAARAGGCARLLTEDLSHGTELAGIRIENPFV